MILPGYSITEEIHEGIKTIIYRGYRQNNAAINCDGESDRQSVILKVLKTDYPTPGSIAQFKHEYQIAKKLDSQGIVKPYGLEVHQQTFALILEDFGGESLKHYLSYASLDLSDCLKIAIQIVDALFEIHINQIIHKDIKPHNIIINPSTQAIKITDFGIASLLSRETPAISHPNTLEGTLAYISPEQTGRMNRAIDYRTDLYSLGVTLYELFSGQLPFTASDPMELVHCHIARKATPLHELNSSIPLVLSNIVSKLLAKMAEDRYQSAYGLKVDLERCQQHWQQRHTIPDFAMAQCDRSERFQIPQKLYGREPEIALLLDTFTTVSQGKTELVLISGASGIGKSALVHEIHKPLVQHRGYFVAGKFDQLHRNSPYASLIQAFQQLIRQILTESKEAIAQWRYQLSGALGVNGQVIVDVIPEVEWIIGSQPALPQLLPQEAQNRFHRVLQQFVGVFAQTTHPLVLFLDDLQWADGASFKLIQRLVTDSTQQAMLILGAYRSNEVSATHPLMVMVDDLQSHGKSIREVRLSPLDLSHTCQLLADTFDTSREEVQPLAELVLKKTNGNPFFLSQFLKSLYTSERLTFDIHRRSWQWDLHQIRTMQITDNVVEFMADRLQTLSPQTQQILKFAACIGNQFELDMLSLISGTDPLTTADTLWEALRQGLILPVDDAYQTFQDYSQNTAEMAALKPFILDQSQPQTASYYFLHDRVQQAAYSLIPAADKQAIHLHIARSMLRQTDRESLETKIFDITNHFNLGIDLITTVDERYQLAQFNLIAGRKARASTAYEPALNYLAVGMDLLTEADWQTHYDLMLALHVESSQCEYLIGQFDRAEAIFNQILDRVKRKEEKADLYAFKVVLYTNIGQAQQAIDIGLEGLSLFNLNFTTQSLESAIQQEITTIQTELCDRSIEELYHLPTMTAPDGLAVMNLLISLAAPTYFMNINLWTLIVAKMVALSLTCGNSSVSSFAYTAYGLLMGSAFGDYQAGHEFGQLGLRVNQKFNNIAFNSKIYFMVGAFIHHWRNHVREDFDYLRDAFAAGNETGDPTFACYASNILVGEMFLKADPLEQVYRESRSFGDYVTQAKDTFSIYFHTVLQQMVLSLQGLTDSPISFNTDSFPEAQKLQEMQDYQLGIPLHFYYITKLQSCFLFGNYPTALQMAIKSEEMIQTSFGLLRVTEHYFYYALTLAALYPNANAEEREQYWKTLLHCQEKLNHWADHCPENCLHKYLLITAEIARLSGQELEAMDLYDQAIASAQEQEFTQNESLANELAARFYLSKKRYKIAKAYMTDARHGYLKWGATAKVNELDKKYPRLISRASFFVRAGMEETRTATATTEGDSLVLDLTSVLKASQTLSKEIVLGRLLQKMMRILIENAGAERGFLILESQGQLLIEAQGSSDRQEITTLQSVPLTTCSELPISLIEYVERTGENIVLHDATQEELFARDPYIIARQPLSVLCFPILNKGKLIGILYLENNLMTGAFTPDRLEVLQILSSQSAIAIENARLYTHLDNSLQAQIQLTQAYGRFVPHQFLQFLGKESITEVELGDQVQLEMSVLFADICDFTALSERMTPSETFRFINSYLGRMESVITDHGGFVDKYIGDSIMALFSGGADDAVRAAIAMMDKLVEYNQHRQNVGHEPIRVGLGINTGSLMLGTVGGRNRMDGTVLSDAVNLAARIEKLTRDYGVTLLISHQTYTKLQNPDQYGIRMIDQVKVKGKTNLVTVYEVFDADVPEVRDGKRATVDLFVQALALYNTKRYREATRLFETCLKQNPSDTVARIYRQRCLQSGLDVMQSL